MNLNDYTKLRNFKLEKKIDVNSSEQRSLYDGETTNHITEKGKVIF